METGKKLSFIVSLGFYASIIFVSFFILKLIPLFWPFLTSFVLAYIFKSLARHCRARTKAAAASAGIAFYLTVFFLFWLLTVISISWIIELSQQLPDFYNDTLLPYAQRLSEKLLVVIRRFAPASAMSLSELFLMLSSAAQEIVTELSSYFLSGATAFLKRLPLFFIGFVFMIISSFTIVMDYDRVTQFIMKQVPHNARPLILDIKNFLVSTLFKMIKAYAIIMLVTFFELSMGLWALRIPSFWKYAAAISLLDILPVLGSGAVIIPWGIIELLSGRSTLGIGLLALYAVMTVVRNIIEPHIVGDSLGLHPVVTLTAMFLGLRAYGIIGMLSAPVAVLLIKFLNDNKKIRLYR